MWGARPSIRPVPRRTHYCMLRVEPAPSRPRCAPATLPQHNLYTLRFAIGETPAAPRTLRMELDKTTTPHMLLARNISDSTRIPCFINGVFNNAEMEPSALFDTNQQTATCATENYEYRDECWRGGLRRSVAVDNNAAMRHATPPTAEREIRAHSWDFLRY